jgi:hypothetical protein
MLEVIKCKCEKIFAACVDGMQDREWNKNKAKYKKLGCSTYYVDNQDFKFESCECSTIKEEYFDPNQLKINF